MTNIEQHAEQILQEDPIGFCLNAIKALAWHKAEDILLDIANLYNHPPEALYGSDLLSRLYQHAALLNKLAKEEAITYAKKEHELANQAKEIFFPEEKQK